MNYIFEYLKKQEIEFKEKLYSTDFLESKGLSLVREENFNSMLNYFKMNEPFPNLIPLLTDGNSNYVCVYGIGLLQEKVILLNHSEPILSPKFKNLTSFLRFLSNNTGNDIFYDMNKSNFDFPKKPNSQHTPKDITDLKTLWKKFNGAEDDYERTQLAYCICDLTRFEESDKLEVFLNDDDFYIQEYVINVFAETKYKLAKEKIKQIAEMNIANASDSAKRYLKII